MDKRPLFTGNLERFDAAYEAILNAKWEVSGRLMEELIASYDDRASKKLLRILYSRGSAGGHRAGSRLPGRAAQ